MNAPVWTPDALAAALAVLTAAVCAAAITTARTYAQVVNLLEGIHRSGVAIRGAKGSFGGAGAYGLVARPPATAVPAALPMDPINQLSGITVTPQRASTGPVDCGPACVVSCIEELKGCWSADQLLRLRYFGTVDDRLTTARDLAGMLQANGIAAHVRENVAPEVARQEITRNWQAGRPAIILGGWVAPGLGHWVKVVAAGDRLSVMNPYPGANGPQTWDEFAAQFMGDYVHIDGIGPNPFG